MQFSREIVRNHLIEPGRATPIVIDPALALARQVAHELRGRVDELEAENRRLHLALGLATVERDRLRAQLQGKKKDFRRT